MQTRSRHACERGHPVIADLSDRTEMALPTDSLIGRLLAGPMRPGRLEWIGLRPARRAAVQIRNSATLIAARGIEGDRYKTERNGPRQVTLVAAEDLAAIAAFLGLSEVAPE